MATWSTFIMNGCTMKFKIKAAIIKLGRARTFFNITDYFLLKDDCHIQYI